MSQKKWVITFAAVFPPLAMLGYVSFNVSLKAGVRLLFYAHIFPAHIPLGLGDSSWVEQRDHPEKLEPAYLRSAQLKKRMMKEAA